MSTVVDVLKSLSSQAIPEAGESYELELRFGTARHRNRPITRFTYIQIIGWLRSLGFKGTKPLYFLRTSSDSLHDIRAEVSGQSSIQEMCKSDKLLNATYLMKNRINTAEIDDYNTRLILSKETVLPADGKKAMEFIQAYANTKKIFRYMCRSIYTREGTPFKVEATMVRQSVEATSLLKSNVFMAPITYEIEVEFDTTIQDKLLSEIKYAIKCVAGGIQSSIFPISASKSESIVNEFLTYVYAGVKPKYGEAAFIGPQPISLQHRNIQDKPIEGHANIRTNYSVTDKADGLRKLLYIASDLGIYLIDSNMCVQYTGRKVDERLKGTVLDGEHVMHDKKGDYVNLYMMFDVYYVGGNDVRSLPLAGGDNTRSKHMIAMEDALRTSVDDKIEFNIVMKTFYYTSNMVNIFTCCKKVIQDIDAGKYIYETDGLILTPMNLGVGAKVPGERVKTVGRRTWFETFKWKPSEFNTIDFLVEVMKDGKGNDIIYTKFDVVNGLQSIFYYKTIRLRVRYNESRDGIPDPCKYLRMGMMPEERGAEIGSMIPALFYPEEPTSDTAHICNIKVKKNQYDVYEMFTEEGDVIEDYSIVECKYDLTGDPGWQWIPLRVRYDKTVTYRSSTKLEGFNTYMVANENWRTIHNPITQEMMTTGKGIPSIETEDVYYAISKKTSISQSLRDFHNRFVKLHLLNAVATEGCTILDFSVGRGGDLYKWFHVGARFVLGVDIDANGINNRMDGACKRYIDFKSNNPDSKMEAFFVHADSSKSIKGKASFSAMGNSELECIFGIKKNESIVGKGVLKHYGVLRNNAMIGSIQFSIHYMFKDKRTLYGLMRNFAECIQQGGVIVGTTYDGNRIFEFLSMIKMDEYRAIYDEINKTEICRITKKYVQETMPVGSESLGLAIEVYQNTIGHSVMEYLVNFEYLETVMDEFGFVPAGNEEYPKLGMNMGIGSFQHMFNHMGKHNKYGTAERMNEWEKTLSFMNNYFVFRKIKEVDCEVIFRAHNFDVPVPKEQPIAPSKPPAKKTKRKIKVENTEIRDI